MMASLQPIHPHDDLSGASAAWPTQDCPLLNLPVEIFHQILGACATNGVLADCGSRKCALSLVCRAFYGQLKRLLPMSGKLGVDCLERIVIQVDATYRNGVWLQIIFCWRPRGFSKLFMMNVDAQDMSDATLERWFDQLPSKVNNVDIHMVAPLPSSDGLGAFLMLFTKARDAMEWTSAVCDRDGLPQPDDGSQHCTAVHIRFEGPLSCSSVSGIPFWQRKLPKGYKTDFLNFSPENYRPLNPYLYEYILCHVGQAVTPSLRVCRITSIVHDPPLPAQCTSLLQGCSTQVIKDIPSVPHLDSAHRLEDWVASKPTMSCPQALSTTNMNVDRLPDEEVVFSPERNNWKEVARYHIFCLIEGESRNLAHIIRQHLDTRAGPLGGPMAMLRLHRHKTLHKEYTDSNFFSCWFYESDYVVPVLRARRFHLRDIADEVALSMHELFHPAPTAQALACRQACSCLAAFPWPRAQDIKFPRADDRNDRLWIEAYPNGISHNLPNGMPMIAWSCKCKLGCFQGRMVARGRTWECHARCSYVATVLGKTLFRNAVLSLRSNLDAANRTANGNDTLEAIHGLVKQYDTSKQSKLVVRHEAAAIIPAIPGQANRWLYAHWSIWGRFAYRYDGEDDSGVFSAFREVVDGF